MERLFVSMGYEKDGFAFLIDGLEPSEYHSVIAMLSFFFCFLNKPDNAFHMFCFLQLLASCFHN